MNLYVFFVLFLVESRHPQPGCRQVRLQHFGLVMLLFCFEPVPKTAGILSLVLDESAVDKSAAATAADAADMLLLLTSEQHSGQGVVAVLIQG
jgi:hypothetical protein